jgi:hypothetical protein
MRDTSGQQFSMQTRTPETSLARLVDHGFTRVGAEVVDNVMAIFASHEQPAHRPLVANAKGVVSTWRADLSQPLCRR